MTDRNWSEAAEKYAGVENTGKVNWQGKPIYAADSEFALLNREPKMNAFIAGCEHGYREAKEEHKADKVSKYLAEAEFLERENTKLREELKLQRTRLEECEAIFEVFECAGVDYGNRIDDYLTKHGKGGA